MCAGCDGKGYIETFTLGRGRQIPILEQCRRCKDIEAYSRRVQEIMGFDPKPVLEAAQAGDGTGRVLQFPQRAARGAI